MLTSSLTWFLIISLINLLNAEDVAKTTTTTTAPSTSKEPDIFAYQSEIVNKHDFNYIYNPQFDICGKDEKLFLLIYVHTAPVNFKRRQSLRDTWARRSMFRDLRIVFMMGYTSDFKAKELVRLESGLYNDIVMEDFVDSYKNLTYKGIMAMKWISQYCNKVKYILKVDDDIVSNIFILLRHLKSFDNHKIMKQKTIMCLVWVGMVVMRDKNSKWYLSKDDFKPDVYGRYCSGSAYLLTGDLPALMYDTSLHTKFFWVDDYFITGILASNANVTHEFINSLYIINGNLIDQRFLGKQADYTVFGHIPDNLGKMYTLWNHILSKQLSSFPSLYRPNANFLTENDFNYIKDFKWDFDIWKDFYKTPDDLNKKIFIKNNEKITQIDDY